MLANINIKNEIARICLNRPEKKNALSPGLINDLHICLDKLEQDKSAKVLVLEGSGDVFCAGMDLKEVLNAPKEMSKMLHELARFTLRLRGLNQPSIAKVQGAAVGGGCGLMAVCDFSWTHPESKIGYPEVSLGVCPAIVAPWLIKKIGPGRARSLLLQGGTFTGQESYKIGLSTHIEKKEHLEKSITDLACTLKKGCPNAMQITKKWLNKLDGSINQEIMSKAAELSAQVIQTNEAQERLKKIYGN